MDWLELIGQDRMIAAFQKALREDKLAHGILLWGAEGTGKSLAADILRTHWLCLEPIGGQPCGKCKSCELKKHGNHPDDVIIDLEENSRNIGIEAVRQVGRILSLAPNIGTKRVIYFPQAGSFTVEAANSLLKLLEEPPPGTLFILEAKSEDEVLPTIRSRCQGWRLQPLSEQLITSYLEEKYSLSKENAHKVSRVSGGSLGIGLKKMEEDSESICLAVLQWMQQLPQWSATDIVGEALKLDKEKKEKAFPAIYLHIEEATTLFRDLLVWKRLQNTEYLTYPEYTTEFRRLADLWTEEALLGGREVLEKAQEALKRNGNARLWSEWLWIQLRRILDKSKEFESK